MKPFLPIIAYSLFVTALSICQGNVLIHSYVASAVVIFVGWFFFTLGINSRNTE